MENKTPNYKYESVIQIEESASSRKYMAGVFAWMFAALAISAVVAYEIVSLQLFGLFINETHSGFSGLGLFVVFSPLAFSLVINFGYNRIPYFAMILIYLAYAVVIGASLSFLALLYTETSIYTVFITSSALFGLMAVLGYTTRQDLTKFGSILYMLFIGILVASLINFFLHSDQMSYIISFIGVAVFTGLTAYYTQALKRIGEGLEYGNATSKKLAIVGAFTLYTTFINLFWMMMRLFGRRR